MFEFDFEAVKNLSAEDCARWCRVALDLKWSLDERAAAFEYVLAEGLDTLLDPVLAGVPVADVIA